MSFRLLSAHCLRSLITKSWKDNQKADVALSLLLAGSKGGQPCLQGQALGCLVPVLGMCSGEK